MGYLYARSWGRDKEHTCVGEFLLKDVANPWEVEDYFQRSLETLKWKIPKPEESLNQYAQNVAEDIVSGKTPPLTGGHELYKVTVALDYPQEMRFWRDIDHDTDPLALVFSSKQTLEEEIRHECC